MSNPTDTPRMDKAELNARGFDEGRKLERELAQEKRWKEEDPRMLREQIRVADVAFNRVSNELRDALEELEAVAKALFATESVVRDEEGRPVRIPPNIVARATLVINERSKLRKELVAANRGAETNAKINQSLAKEWWELKDRIKELEAALNRARAWEAEKYAYDHQGMGARIPSPDKLAVRLEQLEAENLELKKRLELQTERL